MFSNPYDEYDLDFLRAAKVLFFSDEGIVGSKKELVLKLAEIYKNIDVIVLGMGAEGAMLYERSRGAVSAQKFASIKIGVSGAANGFVSEEELRANS